MNKLVYLGLPILELSKIVMYELWFDYVKPKYEEEANMCYMDTDGFIEYIKTDDIYKDIAGNVEKNLILHIMNQIDHCLKEENKKNNCINQRLIKWKNYYKMC